MMLIVVPSPGTDLGLRVRILIVHRSDGKDGRTHEQPAEARVLQDPDDGCANVYRFSVRRVPCLLATLLSRLFLT